ncbi:hypothetical protein ACFQGT_13580 [Natrialbaceae archaeon GCM10025810]|uniref:type II toxin-antitoxin system HicB family antitoxin n=1 Tax=Halovalidus salilacus TaxID=3075124 RepID=UPI003619DC52
MPGDESEIDDALAEADVTVTVEKGLYIATDEETGVSSQGPTEEEARRNLALALETYEEGNAEADDSWL